MYVAIIIQIYREIIPGRLPFVRTFGAQLDLQMINKPRHRVTQTHSLEQPITTQPNAVSSAHGAGDRVRRVMLCSHVDPPQTCERWQFLHAMTCASCLESQQRK
jgi:hypothetical protein